MLTQLRARMPERGDDTGISLIEVLVAMGLSTIVMAMTLNFFIGSLHFSDTTTSDSINTAQARTALDSWSQLIRLADSPVAAGTNTDRFEKLGPDDLVFYANLNNRGSIDARTAPTKIWLSVAHGTLVERRYLADNPKADPAVEPYTYSRWPSSPTVTRILAGCAGDVPTTACATPGTVHSSAGFIGYTPASDCAANARAANGLCPADPANPQDIQHTIAVGVSFTMTTANGKASKSFTTLASVSGSDQ